jgi:gamma-glutamylcysteine synthetase
LPAGNSDDSSNDRDDASADGGSASENNDEQNTTGEKIDETKIEGKLRQSLGEDRKILLEEMAKTNPKKLSEILEKNSSLQSAAQKHGIDVENLKNASAEFQISETFLQKAKDRNLNRTEAEKVFEMSKKLQQSGLSEERATDTAMEELFGGNSQKENIFSSIATGGTSQSTGQLSMISSAEFLELDGKQQKLYREKFGNKFTD